jgi:hypothetical protein
MRRREPSAAGADRRQFAGEASNGDSSVGFSYLPRGYYQRKDKTELP